MAWEIISESYGRRLPFVRITADSTDDFADIGTLYAEGSTVTIGKTTYKLDKVQGWIDNSGGGDLPSVGPGDDGKVLTVIDGAWQAAQASGGGVAETTYAELKAARDGGTLVPGQLYRITDYVTKINGTYDLSDLTGQTTNIFYAKSAEHPFDLVVLALDESHLDEHAVATHHEGDTYFADSALEQWDIRYTIDNDPTKYSWADATNGKGVITYMKDENANEAYYDFKNAQFLAYALKMADSEAEPDTLCYDNGEAGGDYQPNRYGSVYYVFQALQDYMRSGIYATPFPNGIHDFALGQLILTCVGYPAVDAAYLSTFGADWYYTFDMYDGSAHADNSLTGERCYGNTIGITPDTLATTLNLETVPMGLAINIFEATTDKPYNNGNELGDASVLNIFGGDCSFSAAEGQFIANIFGEDCQGNSFGTACGSNSFGAYCSYNSFGAVCNNNSFGASCNSNSFGEDCYSNSFGEDCRSNSFGASCNNNSFGAYCQYNTLGELDSNNELQGYVDSACFGKRVQYVELTGGASGSIIRNYHVCDMVQGIPVNKVQIAGVAERNYETWVGYNSSGVLKTWVPADLAT